MLDTFKDAQEIVETSMTTMKNITTDDIVHTMKSRLIASFVVVRYLFNV